MRYLEVLTVTVVLATPLLAEAASPAPQGPLRKLGRGIANVVTAPAELIRVPELVNRKEGYVAAISVGLIQGISHMILRGLSGGIEILTFYLPIPKGYMPLIRPEFVWAQGDWTP